jgi:hypothetical protein
MITEDKIRIYKKYSGDIDGWVRVHDKEEMRIMSDQDWYDINLLLQEIAGIKNGIASEAYAKRIEKDLTDKVNDEKIIKMLFEIA